MFKKVASWITSFFVFLTLASVGFAEDKKVKMPSVEIYQPDVNDAVDATQGLVSLVSIVVAILGSLLLFYAIWRAFVMSKQMITEGWNEEFLNQLKYMAIAIIIIILGITDAWYDIIVFIQNTVFNPAVDKIK